MYFPSHVKNFIFFPALQNCTLFRNFNKMRFFILGGFNFMRKIVYLSNLVCLFAYGFSLNFSTSVSFYLICHGKHPVETSKGAWEGNIKTHYGGALCRAEIILTVSRLCLTTSYRTSGFWDQIGSQAYWSISV